VGLPLGNAWCPCLPWTGGGTCRCKNFREHARQLVVICTWWAAPRYSFSSDTLPPLHPGRCGGFKSRASGRASAGKMISVQNAIPSRLTLSPLQAACCAVGLSPPEPRAFGKHLRYSFRGKFRNSRKRSDSLNFLSPAFRSSSPGL
jgi:hypothetical protein